MRRRCSRPRPGAPRGAAPHARQRPRQAGPFRHAGAKKAWRHKRRAPTAATPASTRPHRRLADARQPDGGTSGLIESPPPPHLHSLVATDREKNWPEMAYVSRTTAEGGGCCLVPEVGVPDIVREVEVAPYTGAQWEDDDQVAWSGSRDNVCGPRQAPAKVDIFPSHFSACPSTDQGMFPSIFQTTFIFHRRLLGKSAGSSAHVQHLCTPRGPTTTVGPLGVRWYQRPSR